MKDRRHLWLKQRLEALGKTQSGLARALGVDRSAVTLIVDGARKIRGDEVGVLAQYLDMGEGDVVARLAGRGAGRGDEAAPDLPVAKDAFSPRVEDLPAINQFAVDLPVYGTAVGGSDGDFEMNGEVVDRVRRPPGLTNVKTAFGLYVVGNSMEPRFREGDLVYIHPARRPAVGCDVVVELHAEDDWGRPKALLKEYRGSTPSRLVLWQHNPAQQIEVPLDQVKHVYRVLTVAELMGV